MRRFMTKEVTQTAVKCARMETKDGQPVATPMEDIILLGNVRLERAQREMKKEHGENVVVLSVQPKTIKYRMAVEEFILLADPIEESDSKE